MKSMMIKAAMLSLIALATPTQAHHSAAQFDFQNTVLIEGLVKQTRFANPHMRLVLELDDSKGTREVEFEGHSRNNMQRQGLLPEMFGDGDTITIRIAPMRNGSDGGYVLAVRTPSGEEIGTLRTAD